ncbi:UNVERIFIED_CONTAM: hypothetical protein GTU68_009745 [Idotea baltica]|nr:hypothetical protein [Idotea baltica]
MDRSNVDTDLIIPKQFLKSIKRSGFGQNLFDELRYLDRDFPLNNERYRGASILLSRENFGCGSSREHAAWALEDYGFRCIIAVSFADIFFNNCFKNGILPIALDEETIDNLFGRLYSQESFELDVDLEQQLIALDDDEVIGFEVDPFRKQCLLNGHDDIDLSLQSADAIRQFELRWRRQSPWLFDAIQ